MADEKEMVHLKPSDIQYATAEDVTETIDAVVEVDKAMRKTTSELKMLGRALDNLKVAKDDYDLHAESARIKMQNMIPRL